MHLYSPTQITLFRNCERAWAFRYLGGIKSEQGAAAALGTEVDDTQLQPYLRDGRGIDFSRESGYIAAAGIGHLPEPMTHDLQVQVHFEIPSPTWRDADVSLLEKPRVEHVGFGYQGYVDLWLPHGGMPGIEGTRPVVCDFKTTGNWKYAKTPSELASDPQAMLYATAAMYESGAREIDLAWVYFATKGPRKSKRVHLRVLADHVAEQFVALNETALDMDSVRLERPDPLSLTPNPNHCGAFNGCPHVETCNLSPSETIDANLARFRASQKAPAMTATSTMSLLEQLKADRARALGAPSLLAARATAPVDPLKVEPPRFGTPPPVTDADRVEAAARVAALIAAPVVVVGINPPESALPPAPPVGSVPVSANASPAADVSERVPADEKPKRGRPRKDPAGADAMAHTGAVAAPLEMLESISVTWAKETFAPVAYNSFDIGPFEATGYVRAGETLAQAHARIYAELVVFAEEARTAKAVSNKKFLDAIGGAR